jgi:hypothetical protein
MIKTINRYLPRNVLEHINKSSYKNPQYLYIICDMIYRISNYHKKDSECFNPYIDIPVHYFTDIITSRNTYYKAINYLKDHKIIECDERYSEKRGKALGYRFHASFVSKLVTVVITKPTLVKRIINNKNSRNNYVSDLMKPAKDHFMKTFAIDYKLAVDYISKEYLKDINKASFNERLKALNKFNAHYLSITAIKDGDLFFKKNLTNGRVDSNLTNLKSELKQFITHKNLVQIDIINSQPYLLSLILRSENSTLLNHEEVIKYSKITSNGNFYEHMMDINYGSIIAQLPKDEIIQKRKNVKNIMFCVYYSKNTSYLKEKKMFEREFPTIMRWINEQKEQTHNTLAIKMQKVESQICIDIITNELNKEEIDYYTIHDAWLVDNKNLIKTIKIISQCFFNKYDGCPQLDIKAIN